MCVFLCFHSLNKNQSGLVIYDGWKEPKTRVGAKATTNMENDLPILARFFNATTGQFTSFEEYRLVLAGFDRFPPVVVHIRYINRPVPASGLDHLFSG
ncbi:unnamed protein product [Lupinus luteus]|uniref:Uncharacterized protein n=1 Tax=Lupinus luteus TaxID=3873 RepID=A0AAV1XJ87_LUPLU